MKTNLNNIWQKCSWRNLQQNYVQQLSDLFTENRYYKFQDEIQFFSYYNNGTLKNRDSESFRGFNRHFPSLASYYLHERSLLMSWHNIIFLPFSLTYLRWWEPNAHCLAADDAFMGFSDIDRRRCRSVAQTSALLRGKEWTSLRTFAVTLWLELN